MNKQHSSGKGWEDDLVWQEMYGVLSASVRAYIYNAHVQAWQGQEYDMVEDIVQESVFRAYLYLLKVANGEAPAVLSLQNFSKRIAHNRGEDLRRHDERLFHPTAYEERGQEVGEVQTKWAEPVDDTLEDALNDLAYISLMVEVVEIIARFPDKRRNALLTDLANLTDFSDEPTLFEKTLLNVGISLRDYQQALPSDIKLKNRHASLLSIAYRQLREETADLREEWY